MIRRLPACTALLLAGCAHVLTVPPPAEVIAPGTLAVRCEAPCRADDVEEVAEAARAALPALRRWGPPAVPVSVVVLPSHASLEAAVHRRGFAWLRAWARYDVVYLQAPHTWGLFQGTPAQLRDILTHELTHCAMFQAAAGPADWIGRGIPFWFREGLASWAAGQGDRRGTLAELARTLRARSGLDPLEAGEALSRTEPGLAYAAAHWAVVDLVTRRGEPSVRQILAAMKTGEAFDVAFHEVYGESVWRFENRFLGALRQPSPGA